MIVHYPARLPAGIRQSPAGAVDIAPTVLSLVGIPLPDGKSFDGTDLFSPEGKAPRPAFSDGGVRDGRYKLIFKTSGTTALRTSALDPKTAPVELYDLEDDPAESRDLVPGAAQAVGRLLALYRDRLLPLFQRHEAAVTHAQPRFSFAVSAPAFGLDAAAPLVPSEEDPAGLMRIETPSGWLARSSWDNSWLFARPGAKPLKITVPIPKGKYFVVADLWGSAEFEIAGRVDGPNVSLRASDPGAGLRRGPEPRDIGAVDVEGETFSAIIHPSAGPAWFALRYLGFDPIINGKRAGSADPEREKRLRSLGYIK